MLDLEAVPHHYEEAVILLAGWHRDPNDTSFSAYSFPDPEGVVVRLVEVSDQFPTVDIVHPIQFGRSADFPFPSSVAQLSVQDWAKVRGGLLTLPVGWSLQNVQRVRVE